MNSDLAEALVAEEEGLALTAYQDSLGFWTIGYGHLLPAGADWTGHTITAEEADSFLTSDMEEARIIAAAFPHFDELNDVRQAVLISMTFQLGAKPLRWPVFMDGLDEQDYDKACDAGLATLWARQTPARADREMTMLRTGNWAMQV